MPTALAEWTTERPGEVGFYWWRSFEKAEAEVVFLSHDNVDGWQWWTVGTDQRETAAHNAGSLWWPVRLDPPPVG